MIEQLNGTHETVNFQNSSIVRLYRNCSSECFPSHWHIPWEIIAPQINTYMVKVGTNIIDLDVGDILIIASGELHSIKAPTVGVRYILNYDIKYFEHIQDISFLFSILKPYYVIQKSKKPELSSALNNIIRKIEIEYSDTSPYRNAEIHSLLTHFMVILGRNILSSKYFKETSIPQYQDKFVDVCKYIKEHCTENLTIDDISAYAGFSKYHFIRLFKRFTGLTCHEYIMSSRIQLAQALLNESNNSITEISAKTGFNSITTFNRTFKSQLGCTPSQYRNLKTR